MGSHHLALKMIEGNGVIKPVGPFIAVGEMVGEGRPKIVHGAAMDMHDAAIWKGRSEHRSVGKVVQKLVAQCRCVWPVVGPGLDGCLIPGADRFDRAAAGHGLVEIGNLAEIDEPERHPHDEGQPGCTGLCVWWCCWCPQQLKQCGVGADQITGIWQGPGSLQLRRSGLVGLQNQPAAAGSWRSC